METTQVSAYVEALDALGREIIGALRTHAPYLLEKEYEYSLHLAERQIKRFIDVLVVAY